MEEKRWKYNFDVMDTHSTHRPHTVNRQKLFQDVIHLYSMPSILQEAPFRVKFAGEKALDVGGVSRDMFSGFWCEVYSSYFDGGSVLIPAVRSGIEMSVYPVLGTIISHGFLSCGHLPIKLAFPVFLFGPTISITETMMIDSFADYLSTYESGFVGRAVALANNGECFPEELMSKLIDLFSKLGCCEIPNHNNFKRLVVEVATFNFTTKCMGTLYAMNSGIPKCHLAFWKDFSLCDFYKLYKSLAATPEHVLRILKEPECGNSAQARVFGFLTTFIGDMKQQELSSFLRFVTGSSVLIAKEITVTFNSLSGLALSQAVLELSTAYCSYQEFAAEFFTILRSDLSSTWAMDTM